MKIQISMALIITMIILGLSGCDFYSGRKLIPITSTISNSTLLQTNESPAPSLKFSEEDIGNFKLIKKYYNEFNYSDNYIINGSNKEMIFNKSDNHLYFDTYISYDVIYNSDYKMINYYFDCGTSYRGHGSYYIIDESTVINIETSNGTGAYGYSIFKNGVKINEQFKDFK